MKKFFVVAMTAALVLPAAATSAAAQNEKITVGGLFFLDRNGDNQFSEDENVRANGSGVRVTVQGTNELIGTYPTGPDGRVQGRSAPGPTYVINNNDMYDHTTTKLGHGASESKSDANFPLRGFLLNGFTFVDAKGDGVKQDGEKTHSGKVEVTGKTASGADFSAEATPGADGSYRLDLPIGDLVVTAPDLAQVVRFSFGNLKRRQPQERPHPTDRDQGRREARHERADHAVLADHHGRADHHDQPGRGPGGQQVRSRVDRCVDAGLPGAGWRAARGRSERVLRGAPPVLTT